MRFFNKDDLEHYLARHPLSDEAKDYIRKASLGPSRNPGRSGYPSIACEYQSLKMGVSINTESMLETGYAVFLDFEDTVDGYYEQPECIDCLRTYANGSRRLRDYTPDFIALTIYGPFVAQIKPREALRKNLSFPSGDWIERDGQIIDLPAERAFAEMGLKHQIIPSDALPPILIANCRLLLRARQYAPLDPDVWHSCEAALRDRGVCSLAQLAETIQLVDVSPLLSLIAQKRLHADLSGALLSVPNSCLVTIDPHLLNDDVREAWHCLPSKPNATTEVAFPIGKHLQRTLETLDRFRNGPNTRVRRRWSARVRAAEVNGMSALIALAPRYSQCGRRDSRRPEVVLGYCEHVIREHWCGTVQPSPAALYRQYRVLAQDWHPALVPVTRPTFKRLLDGLKPQLARARGGLRVHNAAQSPVDVEARSLPPDRPFAVASADHYLCDVYCLVMQSNGKQYAQRPWLTVLRDCATDAVLSVWLSFRSPSRRSCALVIRQCLRRHGRLPEAIIVDQGADFRSMYFSSLMAHCGIDLRFRPSSFPKFGSEAERYFHQFKQFWLSARQGNCVSMREVRAVSGSHRPEKHACLSLREFANEIFQFNDWINMYCSGSNTVSPAQQQAEGLARFACSGLRIADDEHFMIASAVDEVQYKLDLQRGLHIGHHFFWNPLLKLLVGRRAKRLPVRRDPEHPYRCFAHLDGTWITCLASQAPRYETLDPLQRLVDSMLELDGDEARAAAKEDAERGLVHLLRESDARVALPHLLKTSEGFCSNGGSPTIEPDPFAENSDQSVIAAKTERW